jgi:hypothetical protein
MRKIGIASLTVLFALLLFWPRIGRGQATSGYTQVGTVPFGTNTYTDTTPATGQATNYEIVAVNAAGTSLPSNIVVAVTPSTTGAHSNTLTWTPPTTGGTPVSYVVYSQIVTVPGPPSGLAVVSK